MPPAQNELRAEQWEVLRILYPWYKEEVFRRREQMMRLTAFASAFLVSVLLIMAVAPSHFPHFTIRLFAMTGIALFSAVFIYLILQQRTRHRMAKQTLIEMERILGLYDEGLYLVGKTLYPEDWQTAWLSDRSVTVYVTVITALTALVIASVLTRP